MTTEQQLTEILSIDILLKKIISDDGFTDPLERKALVSAFARIRCVSNSVHLRFLTEDSSE